jgi:hypothetical protein
VVCSQAGDNNSRVNEAGLLFLRSRSETIPAHALTIAYTKGIAMLTLKIVTTAVVGLGAVAWMLTTPPDWNWPTLCSSA